MGLCHFTDDLSFRGRSVTLEEMRRRWTRLKVEINKLRPLKSLRYQACHQLAPDPSRALNARELHCDIPSLSPSLATLQVGQLLLRVLLGLFRHVGVADGRLQTASARTPRQ